MSAHAALSLVQTVEFDEGAGAVLRIQPLRAPRDENVYECVAKNTEGEVAVTSKLSIIREDLLPFGFPSIDMGPQLKVVERTRTATMLCAASGIPDPEISWFKDFLPVEPALSQGRIKQLRSGALQIERSEETDQGKYECVASNSQGVRYSSPANLYVRVRRVPPRFTIPPVSHEIMPGGSVNITCVAVGSPMPYVKWMLNSEDLTPEEEMPVGRNVLELNGVRESANYTCVAMSSLGIIESVAQVIVKSLPRAPGTPVVTETTPTSITITWDSGNPDPVSYYIIQYRAKSPDSKYETVDSITTTRYSIGGLYPNTEYEIRVSAVNTIGQGPPSNKVEARTGEQAPASPPRNIQARILSQNAVMVRWDEPEEPNGLIKGYRVYYTMDPSQPMSNWQIHNVQDSMITAIHSLVPSETYTIRVLAFTSVGDGPFSDPVHVKVRPGVPGQPGKFQEKRNFEPRTSYVVEGLRANTEYTFSLAAVSNKGIGAFTNEINQRTAQAKPSVPPRDLRCSAAGSTSPSVSWAPAAEEPLGYKVRYGSGGESSQTLRLEPGAGRALLTGLRCWSRYRVTVTAITAQGGGPESAAVECRTDEDVPRAPPRQVEVQPINSTSVKVSWRSVLPGQRNGQIRGYQVHYVRMENGESLGLPRIKDMMLDDEQTYDSLATIVPARPVLSVQLVNETSAALIWTPQQSSDPLLEILGFRLTYGLINDSQSVSLDFRPEERQHNVTSLRPGGVYSFLLAARGRSGYSEEVQEQLSVPEFSPKGFPQLSEHVNATCCSLQLTWLPPNGSERNAGFTGCTLTYEEAGGGVEPRTLMVPADASSYTIHGLNPDRAYAVRISAHNSARSGPYSPQVLYRTTAFDTAASESGPALTGSSAYVSLRIHTLTFYIPHNSLHRPRRTRRMSASSQSCVEYNRQKMEVDARLRKAVIPNLQPDTSYDFKITSPEGNMGGLRHRIHAKTSPPILIRRPEVDHTRETEAMVTIILPSLDTRSSVEYNRQKMEVDARPRKAVIPNLQPDTSYDFKITSPEGNMGGLRHRIHAKTSPPILIRRPEVDHTRETEAMVTIILPSLDTRSSVRNIYVVVVPLKRARGVIRHLKSPDEMDLEEVVQVNVSVRVLTSCQISEPGGLCVCVYTDPVIAPDSDPQPLDAGDGLIWVVGPVLAVLFIICIVIAILLYKNKPDSKRKDSEPGTKCLLNNAEMMAHNPTDPVEMRRINFQTPGMMSHPPIPISELPEHTEHLKANDNLHLSQEYESIDPGQQFTWEHSNLEVNKPKNRYANVIAYDHTRVILAPTDGIMGSDYINANYIDGFRKQNAYIATQGPLPETFGDIWRMVWEQRAASVVMMTKLEEKSRIKCDQYWPSRGTDTFGAVQVALLDTMELATFCVRTFSLHKSGCNERREVRQFQFTAWPDHGVPEYPTPFLAFLRRVKACNPPDAGPVIVHCSAGVGRTGCFIVIDAMLERIRHERTVDVYGHVTLMRSQRNYMVQTEDQYGFIHEALLEAVACGNTEVAARSLCSYIQNLSQVEAGEHVTGIELEFKRLANSKAHTSRFVSANLPCNKFKNRLVNIMPYETTRVCLQPIRGLEGSDYINASFIDGYRQQRAYIATQGPLAETTEDFWRMLWEHNSTIVVMLTKLREMGREKCHQYWPAERSARYQYFVVDPMAEYNMPQYILREFKVTDARDGQSRTVRQFQFTDWPEQGVPKSGEGFIDFIGQVHKTKEQFGQDGPIAVHCSAGVGRTGVFITLSIVLERMRYEGAVDIFQTVKMLRTQRPAMVQTEDEYQFCYQAALEYLGSFDHYAT
ncbi:receptor-type tyrosine-protein phosphatase delta-like [Sinocyclocheilus anshuiensis]|uniref:receptor-type tyrosine-protein phosphatase delta-like n=1 Tax=Sinocyclocheilus anshuiensis TaxID=1608454 RepID=UPI0007B9404E|nr:PREDICTED: receptor-type tyrosine-protein phosphatase delta-like [Sinocyclocheilus anshuiensis]